MSDIVIEDADIVARPKRGRPAVRTAANARSIGQHQGDDIAGDGRARSVRENQSDDQITRKSRGERTVDVFSVPAHLRKRGWDYQWWPVSILGEAVGGGDMLAVHEGGWRPVRPSDMPEMRAPGETGDVIDRHGQRLFQRPMHLTQEARKEDHEAAEQQRRDRIEGALAGRPTGGGGLNEVKGVRAVDQSLDVFEEVGSQAAPARRR